jgi:hypothetical protein
MGEGYASQKVWAPMKYTHHISTHFYMIKMRLKPRKNKQKTTQTADPSALGLETTRR